MRGVFFKLRIRTTSLVFDNFSPFDSTANNIVNFEGEQKRLSLSIEKEVSREGRQSQCQRKNIPCGQNHGFGKSSLREPSW